MEDFEIAGGAVEPLKLDSDGDPLPQKTDKIALVDADTLAFAVCKNLEETTDLFDPSFYTSEEWQAIVEHEGFNLMDMTQTVVDPDAVMALMLSRLDELLDRTGCIDWELHFTVGRRSFRYDLYPDYKASRTADLTKIPPVGLKALKAKLCEVYPTKSFAWAEYEADDTVIAKLTADRDKYILCAVDKDVLYSEPGEHYNYYSSHAYKIKPKFITVDNLTALQNKYVQTLTGDGSDDIEGIKGVGKVKAKKVVGDMTDDLLLWTAVVEKYEAVGLTRADAMLAMSLVNMHQVKYRDGEYKLELWQEPKEFRREDNI